MSTINSAKTHRRPPSPIPQGSQHPSQSHICLASVSCGRSERKRSCCWPAASAAAPECAPAHRIAAQKALDSLGGCTDIEVPAVLLHWDADLGGHTLEAASAALVLHKIGARVRPRISSIANLLDHASVLGLHARPLLRSVLLLLPLNSRTGPLGLIGR